MDTTIKLEDKVIDLSSFQIRSKVTESDLEAYYDSIFGYIHEISDYFEDQNAFNKAIIDSNNSKRPKLISRQLKYPFLWELRPSMAPLNIFRPATRRLHGKYFFGPQCLIKISKQEPAQYIEKPLDFRLHEDIEEKFKQYPNYEAIIEIPNDSNSHLAKSSTYHEALHYIIARYQVESGRDFTTINVQQNLSKLDKYALKHLTNELIVECLTDKLLCHDPDAQFEARWPIYSFHNGFRHITAAVSGITIGLIIGASIYNPYLLPLILAPERIRDSILYQYKQSKKTDLLQEIEYPQFKL